MVQPSNPKHIHSLADVARKGTVLVNQDQGRIVCSKSVCRRTNSMGTSELLLPIWRSRDALPFQEALYDLAVPTAHLTDRPSTATFMDTIVTRQFRTEI